MRSMVLVLLLVLPARGQDLSLSLDAEDPTWRDVIRVADGHRGAAARFSTPSARIDAGACPVDGAAAFTLRAALRTQHGGFCTPVMARDGDSVGLSLVMGRVEGRISFEAWSWASVRLISKTRVDDGRWHTIEVPYDPERNAALLLVDGRLEAAAVLGPGAAKTARLRLGNNIGAHQPYSGDIDEVHVVRRTLHRELFDRASIALNSTLTANDIEADLAAHRQRMFPRKSDLLSSPVDFIEARVPTRRRVQDALGLLPWPERKDLDAKIHGHLKDEGVRIERISFQTWPSFRATGWLWLPDPKPEGRLPAVLCPHGHWADGALHPDVQARGRRFAEAGYVVLFVDSVHVEDIASGVNSVGAMTWNNIRALDYLAARPDVDPARIGVTGASGGAQQTMYLMAVDARPMAAAPICMMSWFAEIVSDRSAHCGCNHVPRIAWAADEPLMCGLFAPKPAFFGSVTGDWTHRWPREGHPELRALWTHLGHQGHIEGWHEDAGHNYGRPMREKVYAFFDRHLAGREGAARERETRPVAKERLLALGPPPRVPPPTDAMVAEHRARRSKVRHLRDLAPGLPFLVSKTHLEPAATRASASWERFTVRGPDGVRLPISTRGDLASGPIVLVAASSGHLALVDNAWVPTLPRVALCEARYHGAFAPFAAAWRRNDLLLGRGEGYQAAHDLALAAASLPGTHPVYVVGLGSAGVEALIAASLTPRIQRVVVEELGPRYAQKGERTPLLPEILRFGDLSDLVDLASASARVTTSQGEALSDAAILRALN